MKKIIIAAFLSIFVLVSCDRDSELRTVSNEASAPTLVNFAVSSASLSVAIGTTGKTVEVPIFISTVSDVERTFNIEVDAASTADAANYSVPATFSIPAGSYEGSVTVTGDDVNLTTTATTIILNIADVSDTDNIATGDPVTLNIFQVCPIPDDYFIGSYEISDNQIVFGGANFDTNIVDVTIPEGSETSRQFTTTYFGNRTITVVLNLVCNELIFSNTYDTRYTSAGAAIILRPASDNGSTYDLSNDAFFVVEYDNEAGGNGTFEGSFFLIKQ
jgi:hypothetical protein